MSIADVVKAFRWSKGCLTLLVSDTGFNGAAAGGATALTRAIVPYV